MHGRPSDEGRPYTEFQELCDFRRFQYSISIKVSIKASQQN